MIGWELLFGGFINALSPVNLISCFMGCLIGTIVGVLPGLGPAATMALMLPFTIGFGPETGLIMMAGIFFGAQYGGSTTSILVNIPGEAASVVTCLDGYQMTKKGRAGAALAASAVGSFVAGTIGIIGLQLFSPILGTAALAFGPPEYLALMILAFTILSNISDAPPHKVLLMISLGLFVSSVGLNALDSVARFTMGFDQLMLGLEFLPIVMGFFGIAEVLNIAVETYVVPSVMKIRLRDLYPTKEEAKRSVAPILRGSFLGFFLGLIPGPSVIISTFLSYSLEKRLSKTPEAFGTGMIEGVAAPESANNSAVMGQMIPFLTLGIPFTPVTAIMMAGLLMHNVTPGPMLFQSFPHIFWTFIAAMYLGNIMLVILNLPLVGLFARLATLRPQILMPCICIICLVGVYSVRNALFDVWVMIGAGILGYLFRKWKYPVANFVIGAILGPFLENNLRMTLMTFRGDMFLIFEKPIAMAFLYTALAIIVGKFGYHFLRKYYISKRFPKPEKVDDSAR
jgi:putative tricarboxylic transport membrane protein